MLAVAGNGGMPLAAAEWVGLAIREAKLLELRAQMACGGPVLPTAPPIDTEAGAKSYTVQTPPVGITISARGQRMIEEGRRIKQAKRTGAVAGTDLDRGA
jgi:hypothetical protein